MKKRILAMALVLVMLCGVLPVSAGAAEDYPTFSDIESGQWFFESVKYVWQQGLMDGVSEFQFCPNDPMDRLTMVTVLYRIEGKPSAPPAGFTDVYPEEAPAVDWAASQGIVKGFGDGRFGPREKINRGQMAAMLFRYVKAKGLDRGERTQLTGFTDYKNISDWAQEPLSWAVARELIAGMGDGTVNPWGNATRAQGATVVHRFCEKVLNRTDVPEVPSQPNYEVFEQIAGKKFTFSSGGGGWSTTLIVEADGSFSGIYYDSNLGDIGPGYPNGTVIYCSFRGKFIEPKKLDNYSYSMRCGSIEYDNAPGTEKIVDGTRYEYTDPYGMEGDGQFRVYLTGKSTADLPKMFMDWLRAVKGWQTMPESLPFWALHNVEMDYPFFS